MNFLEEKLLYIARSNRIWVKISSRPIDQNCFFDDIFVISTGQRVLVGWRCGNGGDAIRVAYVHLTFDNTYTYKE
jgi:hypothetical protein